MATKRSTSKKQIKTPQERWARRVLPKISKEYGINEPDLIWRVSVSKYYTSGHCWYCYPARITVTEGTNPVDAKAVFLHEMAHAITRSGHTYKFYKTLWTLIRQYKLPIAECKKREAPKGAGRKAYLDTRPGKKQDQPPVKGLQDLMAW